MMSLYFVEDIFNRLSIKWLRVLLFLLQLLFVILFFGQYLLAPTMYSLAQGGDDFKNYFVLKTYLDQPASVGYFHYSFMNYPFGETIYFTDNSPIVAIFLKWIKNTFGLSSNLLVFVFDLFLFSNFIIAGQILVSLLKRTVSSNLLILAFSLTLPFINPQSSRFFLGTENLSLSAVLLFVILQSIRIVEASSIDKSKVFWRSLVLILFIVSSAFIHLYYLLLSLFFVSPFLLAMGVREYALAKRWNVIAAAAFVSILAFVIVQITVVQTDPFFMFRQDGARGFGWEPWKFSFVSLFTAYSWSFSRFIMSSTQYLNYESFCYLGPMALYGLLLMMLPFVLYKRKILEGKAKQKPNEVVIYYVLGASIVSLFVSMGNEYYFMNNEYVFRNYFNITYFASYFTNKFTHFRCLGRFSWVFFWAVNLMVAQGLDKLLKNRKAMFSLFIYFLIYVAVEDALHTGYTYRASIAANPFNAVNYSAATRNIKAKVSEKYDAIIVLPFFQTGSEDYPNTIDPTSATQVCWMELSQALQTPMFSFMMSRTPLNFNKAQLHFYNTGTFDDIEGAKMQGKKVLIVKNEPFYTNILAPKNNCSDTTLLTIERSKMLPERLGLQAFDSVGDFKLYTWNVQLKP